MAFLNKRRELCPLCAVDVEFLRRCLGNNWLQLGSSSGVKYYLIYLPYAVNSSSTLRETFYSHALEYLEPVSSSKNENQRFLTDGNA